MAIQHSTVPSKFALERKFPPKRSISPGIDTSMPESIRHSHGDVLYGLDAPDRRDTDARENLKGDDLS